MLTPEDFNIAVVLIFMIGILIVGIMSGRKVTTVEEYALGKKQQFSPYIIAITIMVTVIGGGSLVGITQELFEYGLVRLLSVFGICIGYLMLYFFVIPKFIGRFKGCLSSTDIISKFYGKAAAILSAVIITIFSVLILAAQIKAMGLYVIICYL